ncbi:MAG: hypothetical protein PHE18_04415 [Candidatus Omnitrophica bacterium]|nr:hypothetical protein [Candidatus Omnitrophota bacterium]MDD5553102.1 hypothetical protein [Candidatus Omnitrophota bacterium]
MIKFFLILIGAFAAIIYFSKLPVYLDIILSKKKIQKDPLIGQKQEDGTYFYGKASFSLSYRIKAAYGKKAVEWLLLKRRLTPAEERILAVKRWLNKFFLYQGWFKALRPAYLFVFILSLSLFYFGIMRHSFARVEYFKFIIAQAAGISPESIKYEQGGWFRILARKKSLQKDIEPVTISFNPIAGLFFPNSASVGFWSNKLNRYVNYPFNTNEHGDIWMGQGSRQVHGNIKANRIVWDKRQKAGIRQEVRGHRIEVREGKLEVVDE